MKEISCRGLAAALRLLLGSASAPAQGVERHGADSTFTEKGLVVMWAVLRGPDEEGPQVHLQIVKEPASPYRGFAVLALDPFSGEVREERPAAPLQERNRIVKPRSSFQYFSSQRLRCYEAARPAAGQAPELTVYYLGVPDTSPEFNTLQELEDYFRDTLRRLSGG